MELYRPSSVLALTLIALTGAASTCFAQSAPAHQPAPTSTFQAGALTPSTIDAQPHATNARLGTHVGGIFADGATHGVNLINPKAPAKFGHGEKYVTAPAESLMTTSGSAPIGAAAQGHSSQTHRDAGGIKLLTFEF